MTGPNYGAYYLNQSAWFTSNHSCALQPQLAPARLPQAPSLLRRHACLAFRCVPRLDRRRLAPRLLGLPTMPWLVRPALQPPAAANLPQAVQERERLCDSERLLFSGSAGGAHHIAAQLCEAQLRAGSKPAYARARRRPAHCTRRVGTTPLTPTSPGCLPASCPAAAQLPWGKESAQYRWLVQDLATGAAVGGGRGWGGAGPGQRHRLLLERLAWPPAGWAASSLPSPAPPAPPLMPSCLSRSFPGPTLPCPALPHLPPCPHLPPASQWTARAPPGWLSTSTPATTTAMWLSTCRATPSAQCTSPCSTSTAQTWCSQATHTRACAGQGTSQRGSTGQRFAATAGPARSTAQRPSTVPHPLPPGIPSRTQLPHCTHPSRLPRSYERTFPIFNYSRDSCGPIYITIGEQGAGEQAARRHASEARRLGWAGLAGWLAGCASSLQPWQCPVAGPSSTPQGLPASCPA